jgi:hypothetical protein
VESTERLTRQSDGPSLESAVGVNTIPDSGLGSSRAVPYESQRFWRSARRQT